MLMELLRDLIPYDPGRGPMLEHKESRDDVDWRELGLSNLTYYSDCEHCDTAVIVATLGDQDAWYDEEQEHWVLGWST